MREYSATHLSNPQINERLLATFGFDRANETDILVRLLAPHLTPSNSSLLRGRIAPARRSRKCWLVAM